MTRPKTYRVVAERSGDWWAISVPDVRGAFTQAKRLDQVEDMAREAVSLLLDVPADSFEVELEPHVALKLGRSVDEAVAASDRAREAAATASRAMRDAAQAAASEGLTVRDIGTLLHVSPQRVSQLLATNVTTTITYETRPRATRVDA